MSDLVAIVYPSEAKAEEVRQRLLKLQKEYLITISDAVIAVKTDSGGIKLNQLVNTTAVGADKLLSDASKAFFAAAYPGDALEKLWWWPIQDNWFVAIRNEYQDKFLSA